ncbi:MAG: hypothetical protein H7Y17_16300 [Chlorobia bacterium]|nr:hypothetical protein [Fimbriimonadaceae bacterium]
MNLLLPLLLAPATRFLVVGGGPNPANNQVALEFNVQHFARILPKDAPYRVLFADGDAGTATVRFTPEGQTPGLKDQYKQPQLPRLDGAASLENVNREIASLASGGKTPVFLYFTGHGTIPKPPNPRLSSFNLWKFENFTAVDFARSLTSFPKDVPIVALMVQCHSGGFAKSLFKDGDPDQPPLNNRFCGFYASIESRSAAGCTPSINTKSYRDFTTYFVAALAGEDRQGQKVSGADYDGNGKVGMNEAFCYALVNDDSIDTPVCTSDEFVRRVVKMPEEEIFATPYSSVLKMATPAQRGALEALSTSAGLKGEDRLAVAFENYPSLGSRDSMDRIRGFRFVRLAKTVVMGSKMASHSDAALRRRYETLIKDEAANPLRP